MNLMTTLAKASIKLDPPPNQEVFEQLNQPVKEKTEYSLIHEKTRKRSEIKVRINCQDSLSLEDTPTNPILGLYPKKHSNPTHIGKLCNPDMITYIKRSPGKQPPSGFPRGDWLHITQVDNQKKQLVVEKISFEDNTFDDYVNEKAKNLATIYGGVVGTVVEVVAVVGIGVGLGVVEGVGGMGGVGIGALGVVGVGVGVGLGGVALGLGVDALGLGALGLGVVALGLGLVEGAIIGGVVGVGGVMAGVGGGGVGGGLVVGLGLVVGGAITARSIYSGSNLGFLSPTAILNFKKVMIAKVTETLASINPGDLV